MLELAENLRRGDSEVRRRQWQGRHLVTRRQITRIKRLAGQAATLWAARAAQNSLGFVKNFNGSVEDVFLGF